MFDDTPLLIVEDDEGVAAVAARFRGKHIIGVDTESDSMHHYQEKVCLLQFSDDEGDVIVDPLAVDDLSPLGEVLADPSIIKVLHGADYDVTCLARDYNWRIRNLFDTLFAAQFLGIPKIGLADLIERYFGIPVDKKFQRHDWSHRPLEPEHILYARGDTHYLLALHSILRRRLRQVGRLAHQREECGVLARRTIEVRGFNPDDYLNLRGADQLDDTELRVLRRLYLFRDDEARRLDRPTYKVMHDDVLIQLARHKPTSVAALDRAIAGKHGLKRRYGRDIVAQIADGVEDDFKIPDAPSKRRKRAARLADAAPPARLSGALADEVHEALKTWRNRVVDSSPLHSPNTTFSNHELKAISRARPVSLEELAALPGLRAWQVRDHGEAVLAVLERVAPADTLEQHAPAKAGKRRRRRR